ncbi:MAG TPA: DNA cytosine methyltransferase [Desulfotomaculum sp.]|nr:MAG: hypothetical protein JL56_05805 [Desulfotomaculum sp. BICA1-6]HBX23995.1 DNA cytosine methyltransferase [Desulfotomaculum sp.]
MEYTVLHLFSGIGGAALGFQEAVEEYRGMVGKFRTLCGIDVDQEACEDFRALTSAPAVEMDLFTRADYIDFHGEYPPENWREAEPVDLLESTGGEHPDVVFLSPPCKGFSGLLPAKKAGSRKYQALNNLVTRGLELTLQAFSDEPPSVIMLENVPRITSRGDWLLRKIKRLLKKHGYLLDEGYHCCGEIGGLGQRRKRYLLIARLPEKVTTFIYQPPKLPLKTIGQVIGDLPMPGAPVAGPMHRLPRLKWLTWLRLALIPAGGDWRDLETLSGKEWHANAYRIIPCNLPDGTVTSGGAPSCGGVTVADPSLGHAPRSNVFRIVRWDETAGAVVGAARVTGSNGMAAVADPRLPQREGRHPGVYQIIKFDETAPCITGSRFGSGAPAISDPRMPQKDNRHRSHYRITHYNEPGQTVTGATHVANGAPCVADPRLGCRPRNGSYGVQDWDKPSSTVVGAGDVHAGAVAVADPRIPSDDDRPEPPPLIISLDGTWHRPLTTLELAILQDFPTVMPDGRPLTLAGRSDAKWRERIGNAVPRKAARAMARQILRSLLLSEQDAWEMSATPIWVSQGEVNNKWLQTRS